MRIVWAVAIAALAWAHGGAWARADVIELKDGHQVTGEVLAEKANALFVDLGFDVLRIPRDQIVRRGKPGELTPAAPAAAIDEGRAPNKFYDTSPLRHMPVKELVDHFGE